MFINWIYLQHTRNSVCRAAASASLEEAQQEQHGDNIKPDILQEKIFYSSRFRLIAFSYIEGGQSTRTCTIFED